MFCIAIPIESAKASNKVIPAFWLINPANATPTAIPSGILCSVTAKISIDVLFTFSALIFLCVLLPVILFSVLCFSNRSTNILTNINVITPNIKPIAAGIHAIFPCACAISIDGNNKDHTEAAIITPAANPNNIFCIIGFILSFNKNTKDEPIVVPKKGIKIPISTLYSSLTS